MLAGRRLLTHKVLEGYFILQSPSIRLRMTDNSEPSTYNHQKALGEIEQMNKELDHTKEQFIKTKVQAHVLLVDLVSQFSPHMVEKLRTVKEDCSRCARTVAMNLKPDTNDGKMGLEET